MTSRRVFVLGLVAALAAVSASPLLADGVGRAATLADVGEKTLENLPWGPDVIRANLGQNGPVALAQIYNMSEDILAVDTTGKVFCLTRRDLTPKWISSLYAPLSSPPTESPLHYVFLLRDDRGAAYLQWFSRRSGAEGGGSPTRLRFAPLSGVAATSSTAFIGSLGSDRDNKSLATINLADGTPGWGYRTMGRVVATPAVDPTGEIVIVASEDQTVTALPATQTGISSPMVSWEAHTLASNKTAPVVTTDWVFLGSEDNMLRAIDLHSGQTLWMQGIDAPARKTPWLLGRTVTRYLPTGGEGSPTAQVKRFEGFVFARNDLGLHAFRADSGEKVFHDAEALRPVVMARDWVVTLDRNHNAQLRRGVGLPVEQTVPFKMFDFLPTNSRDGTIVAGLANGTIFVAVPK